MIVDVHTHTWNQAAHFREGFLRDLGRIHPEGPPDIHVEWETYQAAVAVCDRTICFGLRGRKTGVAVPNEYVAAFAAQRPDKLIGFMSLDPREYGWKDDFIRSCQDLGLRGVKLGPIYADFDPAESALDWLYSRCVKYNLPVLFHMGTSFVQAGPLACSRPILMDSIAIRFPELRMVIAHLAHPWEAETMAVIRKHAHVYADISALFVRPWQFYQAMVLAQEYQVTHKLLFGSDYPFTTPEESLAGLRDINRFCAGTHLPCISTEVVEGIIHRNAIDLLWGESL